MSCVLVYIRQRQWGKCGESRVLIGYPGYRRAHLVRSRSLEIARLDPAQENDRVEWTYKVGNFFTMSAME